ncbi:hypothetical protein E5D57_012412 [Metarhizium anisopliae]|nr:hypothetical protein E5D57_012412 [Metarhizium anisopliae]
MAHVCLLLDGHNVTWCMDQKAPWQSEKQDSYTEPVFKQDWDGEADGSERLMGTNGRRADVEAK